MGFIYPAYASFKAIKSVAKDDDTQWLTYWYAADPSASPSRFPLSTSLSSPFSPALLPSRRPSHCPRFFLPPRRHRVVYAWFVVIESLTDVLVFWIPFYYLAKIAFLLWCFMPQTRGAQRIYDVAIEPTMSKYEGAIDSIASDVRSGARSVRDEYKDDVQRGAGVVKAKAVDAAISAAAKSSNKQA